MKTKIWSTLLATIILLSTVVCGNPNVLAADADPAVVDTQIILIHSMLDGLLVKDKENEWYYTVTDLDHNGRLEFIAAFQNAETLNTEFKISEVNEDISALEEVRIAIEEGKSFPDFLTDMADTFHDTKTDAWYYLCYDNVVGGENEYSTYKTAVILKEKELSFNVVAAENAVVVYGLRHISYTDANGAVISAEQYNDAGQNSFPGAEKSNTGFEWVKEDKINSLTGLTDCYSVFTGSKKPTESFASLLPAGMQVPDAIPSSSSGTSPYAPVPSATPFYPVQPDYLSITKNPTNEGHIPGETAYFVANANAYDSLYWTFVSPYGGEYSAQNFNYMFPNAPVNGSYSTTLSISNVSRDMDGWGTYCTFYYKGQTARTSTAYLYVYNNPTPAPTPSPSQDSGVYYGSVTDYSYSTVTVNIPGVTQATVSRDICSIDGDLYYGAPATLYWEGMTARGPARYTWCTIQGSKPAPQPYYGSMSGTIYSDTAFTVYVVLSDGSAFHIDSNLVSITSGSTLDGASCTVYYQDYPSVANIYHIDVYPNFHPLYTPESDSLSTIVIH